MATPMVSATSASVASARAAPISVAPSISNAPISTLPAVEIVPGKKTSKKYFLYELNF
mgnify:CR=1 FL=1